MALQRTFSGFPSGCPGLALLLLRFGVGGTSSLQSALLIAATHHAAGSTLAAVLATITSLALIIGLVTPIAAVLLCVGGLVATIDSGIVEYIPLQACPNVFREESAGCRLEVILGPPEYAKALFPTGFSRTG